MSAVPDVSPQPAPRWTHDPALNAVLAGLQAQADRLAEVRRRARELRDQPR